MYNPSMQNKVKARKKHKGNKLNIVSYINIFIKICQIIIIINFIFIFIIIINIIIVIILTIAMAVNTYLIGQISKGY